MSLEPSSTEPTAVKQQREAAAAVATGATATESSTTAAKAELAADAAEAGAVAGTKDKQHPLLVACAKGKIPLVRQLLHLPPHAHADGGSLDALYDFAQPTSGWSCFVQELLLQARYFL